MILLLLFLALIIIATNNLAPQLAESFGLNYGAWNMASTIGPDTNRRGFEIASASSGIEDRGGCGIGSGYCAIGGGAGAGLGARLRQYPHYSLTD